MQVLKAPFDLVVWSCKAYDLDSAVDSLTLRMGPDAAILLLLNGIRHLDTFDACFGLDRVLGLECLISTTLDADSRVIHLNDIHELLFGEKDGARSARVEAIAAEFAGVKFDGRLSEMILQELWEK